MTNTPSPRQLAWELLRRVFSDGAYANLAWEDILGASELSREEKGFATHLAYGTLRQTGTLDRVIEAASGRTPEQIEPGVWWVLRLGAFQWLWMRIPAHAVVNESVKLAKKMGFHPAGGLVNAVMRKITALDRDQWEERILRGITKTVDRLAVIHAHPAWIVDEYALALAESGRNDPDDVVRLLEANNHPARPTLALLPGKAYPTAQDTPTPFSPVGVVGEAGSPGADERVRTGLARVQDEGSQLAALLLTDMAPLSPGEKILDMCSGPGGKAALIYARSRGKGVVFTAIEKTPHRAVLVKKALEPLHDSQSPATVLTGDALSVLALGGHTFDRILLDAPCTGLGALRRRPESRWRKEPSDMSALRDLQRRLLSAAWDHLNPGGVIVYVTCSPVVAETTEQMAWFISSYPAVLLDTPALMDTMTTTPLLGHRRGTAVQLWPDSHHTDAMFIQAIRRER